MTRVTLSLVCAWSFHGMLHGTLYRKVEVLVVAPVIPKRVYGARDVALTSATERVYSTEQPCEA